MSICCVLTSSDKWHKHNVKAAVVSDGTVACEGQSGHQHFSLTTLHIMFVRAGTFSSKC